MPKIKRTKNDKKLRQSIEILKAQLKVDENVKTVKEPVIASKSSKPRDTDDVAIKSDLIKTIILSTFAFGIIIMLNILGINSF